MASRLSTLFHRGEYVFSVLSLIIYMGGMIPLLLTQGASEGDGVDIFAFNYAILNILYLLNYGVVVFLLVLRWRKAISYASKSTVFFLLIIFIPLSFLWSVKPSETLSGSIGMLGTTLFGFYLASRYSLKELLELIGWAFGITIICSIIFITVFPAYGLMGGVHEGTARGIFTHKNTMGKFMTLSSGIFIILAQGSAKLGRTRYLYYAGLIGSVGLILASTSTGSLLNGVLLSGIVFLTQMLHLSPHILVPTLIFSCAIGFGISVWMVDIASFVLGSFNKDLSLTGRADIWPLVIDKIQERPWLGYGFNGFWHGIHGESSYVVYAQRWPVPDSHNGYLDLVLNVGLIGAFLFALSFWETAVKICFIIRRDHARELAWPLVFLCYLIVVNYTETSLIAQNNFFWVMYTSAVVATNAKFEEVF